MQDLRKDILSVLIDTIAILGQAPSNMNQPKYMKMKTIRKNAATGKIYAKSIPTACRPDQQHNSNALSKPMLNSSSNHSIIIQKLGSSRSQK